VCRATTSGPQEVRYAERPGVAADLTSLDVYLPAGCGPVPVVVWVHGGGWRAGDKANRGIETKVAWATAIGAALVAVNYRLSTAGAGVQWPDHAEDVAAALAWIADQGRASGLDPTDVVVLGHSAGAHLVAITVSNPTLRAATGLGDGLRCAVALDTEGWMLAESAAADTGLVANAFGTDPVVLADASPLEQVRRHGAPTSAMLAVTRGTPSRVAAAANYVKAVNAAGGVAELLDVRPYSHEDTSQQLGVAGEQRLTPAVTQFVQGCIGPTRAQ
jgi:arylformamidase